MSDDGRDGEAGSFAGWLEARVPPPLVTAAFAGLMWFAARPGPRWPATREGRLICAVALVVAGAVVAVLGVVQFRRARTTVNPLRPAQATQLVRTGIYAHTRNPMYLGLLLVLLGWAGWLGGLGAWLVLPLYVLYMTRFQIKPEERALMAKFPAAFRDYSSRVRRWI